MQFIALIIIVISLIAIAYRDLKTALIGLAAILVAAFIFYFLSPDENPGSRGKRILSDIELSQTQISRGYANGFVLDLRIHNNNRDLTLQTFTILSRLSDCNTDRSHCLIIGEENNTVKLRTPPGQARDAQINLGIKQLNPVQGVAVWEHEVTGVK